MQHVNLHVHQAGMDQDSRRSFDWQWSMETCFWILENSRLIASLTLLMWLKYEAGSPQTHTVAPGHWEDYNSKVDPEIDWRPEWGGCLSVMLRALLLPTVESVGPQRNRMESCQRDDLTNSLQKSWIGGRRTQKAVFPPCIFLNKPF